MPISNSLIERLFHYEVNRPIHDAIVTPTIKLSYAQLAQLVREQVNQFNDAGITGNSVLGIKCADDTQHLILCLAATHVGTTSCTIPSHESEQLQKAIITRCGVTHVVDEGLAVSPVLANSKGEQSKVASMAAVLPTARLLFSTSGTTGEPKLVVHHDCDLVAQAHRHISSEQERFVCLASMEHNFSKRHRLYCMAMGATNVFVDAAQNSLVAQCQELNVNVIHVSAFQAQELLALSDISFLSHIRLKLGGSHVPLRLRQQLRDSITSNLQAGYGTTETGAIAFTDPTDLNAGESVGQPLLGIEICAVTTDRKPLGKCEKGELAIRCEGMFRGYLGKPELTASRLEDGWFYTGDIGYLDDKKRIHLCGRSDDMFVFNSMNIYPQEIESQICQHPDVQDAAVLPRASSVHGNIPEALVVFKKNITPDIHALKLYVRQCVGVRCPRQFTIVDEIPRNESGKISRLKAINLTKEIDDIRSTIAQTLATITKGSLNPTLITAFDNGNKDIALRKIEMDSLERMELLIVLEINYDTVITPQEFADFNSLGDVVSRVLSPPPQNEMEQTVPPILNELSITTDQVDTQPYVVQFFRRMFCFCPTVTQLNKALTTLDHRLTPSEVTCLHEWHFNGQLIQTSVAEKFQSAITYWLQGLKRMMLDSGKQQAEPFTAHKIASSVTHFVGPGSFADKTLLVCFSERGGRQLMMPNAVLMQHTNSACYDLLIIAEPLSEGYMDGVPPLGKNISEVSNWIARLGFIDEYRSIRTIGCSAGGYAAVVAGYLLGAEMAVCVGGRFHSERYLLKILDKIFTTWRATRKGKCSSVLMIYDPVIKRDQKYARVIAGLSGANLVAMEFTDGDLGHYILQRLVERGELAAYLAKTIFAEMNDPLIVSSRANVIMSFPAGNIRPLFDTQK